MEHREPVGRVLPRWQRGGVDALGFELVPVAIEEPHEATVAVPLGEAIACGAVTLFVVRHAHAGRRSNWTGDDRTRPLSDRGELQAKSLAATIDQHRPKGSAPRILASPARRCVQTVQPLAAQVGGQVVEDVRLFEGAGRDEIATLLDDVTATSDGGDVTVACSHGDVIPILLDLLVGAGMQPERNLVWQKASMWIIDRTDASWGVGRYLPPPDRG